MESLTFINHRSLRRFRVSDLSASLLQGVIFEAVKICEVAACSTA
jgi:hypothetical protein